MVQDQGLIHRQLRLWPVLKEMFGELRMRRLSLVWLLCFLLTACGGGGGGGGSSSSPTPTPAAPSPTPQQVSAAQSAKLTAVLDTATNQATLAWSDTFPAGTSYSIQQEATSGSWSNVDAVPGTTGTGGNLTWAHTVNTSTVLRVVVPESGYVVPLQTPSGNTSLTVAPPATVPTIVLNPPQPVTGNVTLSIAGGGTYSAVQWYVDLNSIGTSSSGPDYSIVLNASNLTAGSHLILAQLETSPDSYIQIRLTIQVQNPEVTLNATVSGTSGNVYLNVNATSAYGITSVSATLDGNSLGTLNAPNCGGQACSNTYQFPINATAAGSGTHTISVQATDGNGVTDSQTLTVVFSNPPKLTVSTPIDGALVNGTLQVAGSFSTDKPNTTVSVKATLGSVTVLTATASPFSASFSLAGVNPGNYTLTVVATDSAGLTTTVSDVVTVTSSPALVYTPILTLGSGGGILAVSSAYVLYQDSSGTIHAHSSTSDTIISLGNLTSPGQWQITDNGYVFVYAFGKDRPGGSTSIYMWPAGGSTPTNLSNLAGSNSIYDQLLPVHYPWVLWASLVTSNWNQYTLYNVSTGQNITVPGPAGITLVGNNNCDFTTAGGLTLYFWTESQNASLQYLTNVYSWSQATGTTTQLSSDNLSLYPQTDGTTIAWQTDHAPPPPNAPYTLTTENIASRSIGSLSTNMTTFQLNSGLLGWLEQTISTNNGISTLTAQSIKASNGSSTYTISNLLATAFFGSSGGFIAYEKSGELYDWSPTGGEVLLFESSPGQLHLAGSTVYFTNGNSQALYAVPMH